MDSARQYNIIVVSLQGDILANDEIEVLKHSFGRVDIIEIPDAEISSGVKTFLLSALSFRGAGRRISEKIRKNIRQDTDAIIMYDACLASAYLRSSERTCVPVIARLEKVPKAFDKVYNKAKAVIVGSNDAKSRYKALAGEEGEVRMAYPVTFPPQSHARHHATNSHALTFVSEGHIEKSFQLVKAMAVARPGSQVRWICLDSEIPEIKEDLPVNFSFTNASTLYDAISVEPVDWLIMLDENPKSISPVVLKSLADGVPVIAVDTPLMEEAISDDCGILFGSDPQSEEFVKGLFPYVESDFRMDMLRKSSCNRWTELFSPESAGRRLVETICLCLDRK